MTWLTLFSSTLFRHSGCVSKMDTMHLFEPREAARCKAVFWFWSLYGVSKVTDISPQPRPEKRWLWTVSRRFEEILHHKLFITCTLKLLYFMKVVWCSALNLWSVCQGLTSILLVPGFVLSCPEFSLHSHQVTSDHLELFTFIL